MESATRLDGPLNKPWPFDADVGPCADDSTCRATMVARRIKQSDYDVVVFEEQFDYFGMTALILELGSEFPYYAGQFFADPIGKFWVEEWLPLIAAGGVDPFLVLAVERLVLLQNSGLVVFSKWPIVPFPNGGVLGWADTPMMDDHTSEVFDDTSVASPISFSSYHSCFHLGTDPLTVVTHAEETSDCFASKGIAAVRLLSPTNRHCTVMFTHTQAAYNSVAAETRVVRAEQLTQIMHFIADHSLNLDSEELVLTGDLNINGDQRVTQSGPDWSVNPEWTNSFDMGAPPGNNNAPFFSSAPALKDAWTYAMGAHFSSIDAAKPGLGIDPGLTWVDQPCTGGCAQTNGRLDYIMLGRTQTTVDRLPMAVHHAVVSYNIGAESGWDRNVGITSATSPGHWLHGAVGNISDHWGLSAEIAPATAYHNPVNAYPVNPSQMCATNSCVQSTHTCYWSNQPCLDDSNCRDCLHVEYNAIHQPGTSQWYKIDSPGTYTFRVNHTIDEWALNGSATPSDNGMHYEVYLPTDLSRPLAAFGDFESESDPGGDCIPRGAIRPDPNGINASGCPFVGPTYKITEAPFYVKVWYQASDVLAQDYPFPYDFTWQRNNGETQRQALPLYPSEKLEDADASWPASGFPERWYAVRVDRSDAGDYQHIRIDANSTLSNSDPFIGSISLMDSDGQYVVGTDKHTVYPAPGGPDRAHFQMFSGNNVPQGGTSLGYLDGNDQRFYLLVQRNTQLPPQAFPFQVRWDTDLTWIMGAAHAHRRPGEGPAGEWHLELHGETQDNGIGKQDDEVALEYMADDSAGIQGLCDQDLNVANGREFIAVNLCGVNNVWGEPVATRRALRYVRSIEARIVEWDWFFSGENDFAPWSAMGPLFPEDALWPGPPDPATAGKYIEPGVLFHVGWGDDDGNYFWHANRANSSPHTFCMTKSCPETFQCEGGVCVEKTTGK